MAHSNIFMAKTYLWLKWNYLVEARGGREVLIVLLLHPYPPETPFWSLLLSLRLAPQREILRYRGTSLIKKSAPPGPYSSSMPRDLWWP